MKDEFEITPHPQGSGLRDNVEKERDSHLSSAVTCCVGPVHSLHPSGLDEAFYKLKSWHWIFLNISPKVKN